MSVYAYLLGNPIPIHHCLLELQGSRARICSGTFGVLFTLACLLVHNLPQQRHSIRKQRRQLDGFTRRQAAYAVLHRLIRHPRIRYAQHIALYLDAFGEVPTRALCAALLKQQKTVYLPFIRQPNTALAWYPLRREQLFSPQRLAQHPLGMRQPMPSRGLSIHRLDVVILPLVLFDRYGHRAGMGGGFYDRSLAEAPQAPWRVGLAYDFQYSPAPIDTQPWDQGLDAVCTPTRFWAFKRHSNPIE